MILLRILVFLIFSNILCYCLEDEICVNEIHSQWGKRNQYKVTEEDFFPVEENILLLLKNSHQREEPVSAWVKLMLDFLIHDLVELEPGITGYKNSATPTLDLSPLVHTLRHANGVKKDVLEKLFLRVLQRLEADLEQQNRFWSKSRLNQEARQILTAVYQNILNQELFPIILGTMKSETIQGLDYIKSSSMDFSVEEIIFAEAIGMASKFEGVDKNVQTLLMTYLDFGSYNDQDIRKLEEIINFGKYLGLKEWSSCASKKTYSNLNVTLNPLVNSLLEDPTDDSVFGEMQTCMLSNMLTRAISGDMFWFEHDHNRDLFTEEQLESIKSVTLASIICEDVGNSFDIQPNVFLVSDKSLNAETPCVDLKGLDMSLWSYADDLEDIIDDESIEYIIDEAGKKLETLRKYEYNLYAEGLSESGNSNLRASAANGRPSEKATLLANSSAFYEFVTYEFLKSDHFDEIAERKRRQINTNEIQYETRKSIFRNKKIIRKVKKRLGTQKNQYRKITTKKTLDLGNYEFCNTNENSYPCDHTAKYRTPNGRCNNLGNPEHGVSNTVLRRLLPSEYNDGISDPKIKGKYGGNLPSPRRVSQSIHKEESHTDTKYTLMVMQWGQFIDHDLSHMPQYRGFNKSVLPCRSCHSSNLHPACYPIPIPEDDPFYGHPGAPKCIPFTRSIGGQQKLGPRQQINQLTSYMDASMVYGNDECQNKKVKEEGSFLLKTFEQKRGRNGNHLKSLLPLTDANHECRSRNGQCFLAGDDRVNEQPGLTALHTIMVREHNHIARDLAGINPHWDNETVYQETRRIVIAMVQHITYNEFLPRVLGRKSMSRFSLNPERLGYSKKYDPTCSASVFTEFSTAAYRFGHSMIKPELVLMSENEMLGRSNGQYRKISLRDHFHNPDFIMENSVDELIRGLVMMPMEEVDSKFTEEIRNHLFEERGKRFSGMDLISLNIQRAREHGIPGYNRYRKVCGLAKANSFDDFLHEIDRETVQQIEKVYSHPDDVDLFTGLMSETKLPGALVGPTLACLLGQQFSGLKACDRFWYETSDPALRFTEGQLKQIRKVSLSGLLCQNCDKMGQVPRTGFDLHNRIRNPMSDCEENIKRINLKHWSERVDGSCEVKGQIIAKGAISRVSPCTRCVCSNEGPFCARVEINNCVDLVRRFGVRAVNEDKSCKPQCSVL